MSKQPVPILCIDFDGVLHSYVSGWLGPRNIPDPPVPGAIKWLRSLLSDPESISCMAPRYLDYNVQIYSSRSRHWFARYYMKSWLMMQFVRAGYDRHCIELLKFPKEKPPASILIDDRGFRFEGKFPTTEELKKLLKPWNKKLEDDHNTAELIIYVGNIGCGKTTYAKNTVACKPSTVVVNMDSIQQMVSGGDYGNYDHEKKEIYWAIEEKAICESLERGFDVIIDRTNMDKKRRKRFIDIGKRYYWVKIKAVNWGPGLRAGLDRRCADPRGTPKKQWIEVYEKMYEAHEPPSKDEGFDTVFNWQGDYKPCP